MKNSIGWECGTYGREVHTGIQWGNMKRLLGRPRCRWEDTLNMDLHETLWGTNWIDLASDWDRWQALVNAVMSIHVP
jgi:hypothetical protein